MSVSMKHNTLIPEICIFDFDKTIDFYTRILRFKIEYQREEEGFAFLSFGKSQIMIDQIDKGRIWKTGEFEYPLGRGVNFQIEVNKIAPLLNNLKNHNINLFLEPEEKWYRKENNLLGNKQFIVQDPDGYLLRFFEDLGTKSL